MRHQPCPSWSSFEVAEGREARVRKRVLNNQDTPTTVQYLSKTHLPLLVPSDICLSLLALTGLYRFQNFCSALLFARVARHRWIGFLAFVISCRIQMKITMGEKHKVVANISAEMNLEFRKSGIVSLRLQGNERWLFEKPKRSYVSSFNSSKYRGNDSRGFEHHWVRIESFVKLQKWARLMCSV